ncbi:MAG: short-chain dehydrogenase/reductase [Thermoleophilaceae bacterium]
MAGLDGKAILITGAARGIGAATARELDRRGARLLLLDLDPEPIERLAAELRHAVALPADVTDAVALAHAVTTGIERLGGLDCAIANAGIGPVGSVEELAPELFERTIDVNLLGAYRTLRLSLPHVRARGGYLLAVASLAAPVHSPLMAHYAASKAGVEAFADALRTEVAHEGVAVGVAYFGWIATEMVRAGMEDPGAAAMRRGSLPGPMRRDLPPEGAARAVAGGIERRARVVAYPWWVRPILAARGLIQPLTELQLRRSGMAAEAVRASARLRPGPGGDNVGRAMRVIDCECGATLQAANDDDLAGQVREHLDADHPDMEMTDDELRGFVSGKAYAASDS